MTSPFPFEFGSVLQAQQLNDITNLPINDQTASYSLVVGDAGKRVVMNVASDNTVTVDDSVFTTGDTIFISTKDAATTITAGAGVTINSASGLVLVQHQSGQLVALSASSFLFVLSAGPAPVQQTAVFNETQANNTNGGTFTSGSFVKRTLNTTVVNQITGCTLTSSVIALPAGTYLVSASAPAFNCNSHQTRLQNTTAATTTQLGSNEHSHTGDVTQTRSTIQGLFTLSATSNLELQHRCGSTSPSQGLGVSADFGNDVMYAQIQITKVA